MRHTIIFVKGINIKTIQELINELKDFEDIDLFFSSHGGEIDAMDILIHYLNLRKDSIIIYPYFQLQSAATKLFTDFQGQIIIKEGILDFLVFHKTDREIYTLRKQDISSDKLLEITNNENKKTAIKLKTLGLNKKQIKKFNKGQDVILFPKDIKKLNINNNKV